MTDAPLPQGWWWRAPMHAAALAVVFLVAVWDLAAPVALGAGVAGVGSGVALAYRLTQRRYRFWVMALAGLGLMALGLLVPGVLTAWDPQGNVGTGQLLAAADAWRWLCVGAGVALPVRAAGERWRAALALEAAVVVAAVASPVAGHRDGMIARPLAISDVFWTHGVDPLVAFLALGVMAAVLVAHVLARRRSITRTASQIAVVLILALLAARHIHERESQQLASAGGRQGQGDDPQPPEGATGRSEGQGSTSPRPNDEPKPSQKGRNKPVAVVVFSDDVKPSAGVYYFRHAAFSQYNGIRLVQSTRADLDAEVRQPFPSSTVQLQEPPPPFRTSVGTDVALLGDHQGVFMLLDGVELSPLVNPDPVRFHRAYRVVSSVVTAPYQDLLEQRGGESTWSDDVWQHYTAIPADPRYKALATQLKNTLKPAWQKHPLALGLAVKEYLEKKVTYSFSRTYEDDKDPTGAFLFSDDPHGYCVHIAHSTAMLLRALRVPARVGAGYAVPLENLGQGSSLLIKSDHAHAWAEMYLRDVGWVPLEVTPERTDVKPNPFVEQDLQQLLGEMARKKRQVQAPQSDPPVNWNALWQQAQEALGWALMAALLLAYAWKAWRWWGAWLVPSATRSYRAVVDRLSAVGITRDVDETPEAFAARLAAEVPILGAAVDRVEAQVLGRGADAWRAHGAGKQVRRAVPWWRWLLGVMHPLAWRQSR